MLQDGGSCGRRRGVAKPWIALVKRRTRVATDRVVSGVVERISWGGRLPHGYCAGVCCCRLLELGAIQNILGMSDVGAQTRQYF